MKRTRFLVATIIVLLALNVAWRIWHDWGLITIQANGQPLSEVMREIERKGGVHLRTNLEGTTPVTLHMRKVPIAMALDLLATAIEARWQLAYLLGPDKASIETALDAYASGTRPEGWKAFRVDLPGGLLGFDDRDDAPFDARRDRWEVKPAAPATLQAYLEQGARSVSARFQVPENWNPGVASAPSSGEVSHVVPRLAKASRSTLEEVFLITGRRRDVVGRGDGPSDGERGGDFRARAERDRAGAIQERIEAEIAKLPAKEREKAQAEFAQRKAFFDGLRDLSPEERRAKMEEMLSSPEAQDRMDRGQGRQDAMRTPQQRADRYRGYLARKQSATNQ